MTPEEFTVKLRRLVDPGLVCYWNEPRQRYVIDRCTLPDASSGMHVCKIGCPRTNVHVVETNGEYRPLGDDLIGYLKSIDQWRFGSLEQSNAQMANVKAEQKAKDRAAVDAAYKDSARDNKIQWNKIWSMVQLHDIARPHS